MNKISENNSPEDFDFNFNFNPEDIETEDTINAVFAVDVSSSVGSYVSELNNGMNEFVQRMQKSHVSEKLFVSIVEFSSDVKVKTGFQPISQLPIMDFTKSIGGMTSLYEGVRVALKNTIDYREGLENVGVQAKSLLFILTDGENNMPGSADSVKTMINDLMKEERNFGSFETILFGIGKENESYFKQAAEDMGIKHVATIENSPEEIKKMVAFISSSVSSASGNGQAISTPNF